MGYLLRSLYLSWPSPVLNTNKQNCLKFFPPFSGLFNGLCRWSNKTWWRETPVTSGSAVAVKLWSCTSFLCSHDRLMWFIAVWKLRKIDLPPKIGCFTVPQPQPLWKEVCKGLYCVDKKHNLISQWTRLHPAQQGVQTVCLGILNSNSGPHKSSTVSSWQRIYFFIFLFKK